ncbi:hypothetical protein AB3S75_030539 [Citrus x aurantiifolia]
MCPYFSTVTPGVELRLRSPSISSFLLYINNYHVYIISSIGLALYQLAIRSFMWQKGPKLRLYLKFFPQYSNNSTNTFNTSEMQQIMDILATFYPPLNDIFGPFKLDPQESGMSKSVMIGIVLGSIACLITESLATVVLFDVKKTKYKNEVSGRQSIQR